MGVPGYFAAARRMCPTAVISPGTNASLVRFDELYIDFNCLVHGCAGRATSSGDPSEGAVLDETARVLRVLVEEVSPRLRVIACADGVPPDAKMAQQRNRRFVACKRGEAGSEAAFDRNKITPGTAFARLLDERMKLEAKLISSETGLEVIYSGTDEAGEGEQKIMRDLRGAGRDCSLSRCVYGLDADLVLLCCCAAAQGFPVPWLCREEDSDARPGIPTFVDSLRLARAMAGGGDDRTLWNHVVCRFFVGNDFLPPLSCLNMGRDTQWLMKLRRICESKGLSLVDDRQLNWPHVCALLRELSDTEERDFAKADADYWRYPCPPGAGWDDYPVACRDESLKQIRPNTDGWRSRFYALLFDMRAASGISRVVGEYVRGLAWTFEYYKGGFAPPDPVPRWYYRYAYGPTSLDVFNYVASYPDIPPSADISGLAREAVTPEQLLRFVTPEASKGLLPDGGAAPRRPSHLFPRDCRITTYLRRKIWECSAVLPPGASHEVMDT